MRLAVFWKEWAFARGLGLWLLASQSPAWAQAPAPAPAATPAQATAPAPATAAALTVFAPAAAKPKGGCLVAHFKALSLKQNDPARRAGEAEDWLRKYVALCSPEQLTSLYANSPAWLGPALTQEIASFLEGAIEARALGNPKLMAALYDSLGKARPSGTVVLTSGTPPAPVLQPAVNPAGLYGAFNDGNLNGSTSQNIQLLPSPGASVGQNHSTSNRNKRLDSAQGR